MWISPITFERPAVLFAIPFVLLFVWLVEARSRAQINAISRRQTAYVRSITLVLIILAAAGMTQHRRTDRLTTIFLLDVSDSISADQRAASLNFIRASLSKQKPHDEVGVVVFGREPFVESPPSNTLDVDGIRATVPGDATDLESGLEAAAGAMPGDTAKRIVLLTDGQENVGNAESTIDSLKRSGIQVDIAPTDLAAPTVPEALVDRIVTPAHAQIGAPFRLRVVLSSTVTQSAALTIQRDGKPIDQGEVHLDQGKTAVYFDDTIRQSGLHNYVANLVPTADTQQQNNCASSVVQVSGTPRVLLLRDANEPLSGDLTKALRVQGLDIAQMSPASAPQTVAGLAAYDSIVLSDVAASDLSPSQITGIAQAGQDFGVGIGMLGGINSFGAGGYVGTPMEDALPVKMTPKSRDRVPGADVVIVLDASGSMSAEEDGVEKVEIAARAALNLLKALQPKDRVAVLAVTETASIVMPLVSPADAAKYVPAIESVEAGGGGIDCRNGLEAAYTMLQTSDAAIKHVIICPDTTDSEQQEGCVALAAAVYKGDQISTSVCGIGQWTDSDVPFQKSLASAGHGQLFVANQAGNLPQFFQRDVQGVEQKLFLEGNFGVLADHSDIVAGGVDSFPNILGYNLVDPKTGAVVPLELSGHDDPLFAYWQHGMGKSFAFTSDDDAHWSRNWTAWPGYPAFWAHVVRWSLKGKEDSGFQTSVSNSNGLGHVVVDAYGSTGFASYESFKVNIAGPDGSIQHLDLSETAPGRYEGSFGTATVGSYLLMVQNRGSGGHQTASVSTSYSPEYACLGPNTILLSGIASQTGGIFLRLPGQVFRQAPLLSLGTISLALPLLFVACVLFLIDVAWRRFGWRLHRQSAIIAGEIVRSGVVEAAGSIKQTARRKPINVFELSPSERTVITADPEFLKRRTAVRADLEDDNPFPFVATLSPRSRQERVQESSKEDL